MTKMDRFRAATSTPRPYETEKWKRPSANLFENTDKIKDLGGPLPDSGSDAFSRHSACKQIQRRRGEFGGKGIDSPTTTPDRSPDDKITNDETVNSGRAEIRIATGPTEGEEGERSRSELQIKMAWLWRDESLLWTEEKGRFREGRKWRQWNGQEGGGKRREEAEGPLGRFRYRPELGYNADDREDDYDNGNKGTRQRWRRTTGRQDPTETTDWKMERSRKTATLNEHMMLRHEQGRSAVGND